MKRIFFILLTVCLLLSIISCTNITVVPNSSSSQTMSTIISSNLTTIVSGNSTTSSKAYSPGVITPAQGGNMLYPTFHKLPEEILGGFGYVPEVMGIINQNGSVISSPQYDGFVYYKDSTGRTQYIIVTGNGKCVIYNLDGTKYMELKAEDILTYNGFPFLLVGLRTYYNGPGSEPNNAYTVYDLRTGKKALSQNYNKISFIDTHTALLRNYGKVTNDSFEYINTYLYDFNIKPAKAVKMDGYPEELYLGPPFADTVTRIPATDYMPSIDADKTAIQYRYLDRNGHWVKKSLENNGVKPLENNNDDGESYRCNGLSESRSFEDRYFWVIQGDFQGYQKKDGTWLYREECKSSYLED